jgi:hypothetical protein
LQIAKERERERAKCVALAQEISKKQAKTTNKAAAGFGR